MKIVDSKNFKNNLVVFQYFCESHNVTLNFIYRPKYDKKKVFPVGPLFFIVSNQPFFDSPTETPTDTATIMLIINNIATIIAAIQNFFFFQF